MSGFAVKGFVGETRYLRPEPISSLGTQRDSRYAYLPFGVGPRTCIGSAFALQEATLAVAMISRNFDFELAPNQTVWPVLKVTLRPQAGLLMQLRPRAL